MTRDRTIHPERLEHVQCLGRDPPQAVRNAFHYRVVEGPREIHIEISGLTSHPCRRVSKIPTIRTTKKQDESGEYKRTMRIIFRAAGDSEIKMVLTFTDLNTVTLTHPCPTVYATRAAAQTHSR